ncbi:putative transcriptional coactivator Hfi1/Transcriptional adapter 1 [Helianthus annuus]|nr:putative transcriptional coactivator Hfi1/Transcriptional adapter 1 [Helianthus annuus]
MKPPQKHSWINLAELKDQLTKNIGPEKSHQYFDCLRRFLSLKISKIEFNKRCLRTVGKDNISLHNQLIRSILKSAVGNGNGNGNRTCYHENGSVPVVHSVHPAESLGKKLEKEVSTSPSLRAPLGIPHWRDSGSRKASSLGTYSDTGGLIETTKLKERMDQLTATQGLRVSMDCASVVHNGLDAYLKRLIRSFSELSGSKSGSTSGTESESMNNGSIKHQAHFRPLINGYRPGHLHQMQGLERKRVISLVDLTNAMELNPQQLGVEWPILLEKVCIHGFTG